jgi:hypothetical protein
VHLVIDDMPDLAEIHGIDDLVVPILFVPIEIFRLTAMPCVESAMLKRKVAAVSPE